MKLPKELQKKYKKTSKNLQEKGLNITPKALRKVTEAVIECKTKKFYCHIKGRDVVFMDCFQCFESPSEDGGCYIYDNALKEKTKNKKEQRKK
jgi:hypothetical protein